MSLNDGVPDEEPLNIDKAVGKAPLEIIAELPFPARLVNDTPRRLKGPSRLVLNSPIIQMKWEQPSSAALVPGPDTT